MTISRPGWRVSGGVAAAIAAAALRWSTAVPLGSADDHASQLRLSLSARPERIEQCRELTDEELAKLPAHMRLRTQCEGAFARYQLTISLGLQQIALDTLRGGGLRHDRPLHVFREQEVRPGAQRVHIELVRLDAGVQSAKREAEREESHEGADTLLGGRADRERDERARRTAEAMPQRLVLDTIMTIPPARVVLVTFDSNSRRLVARMEP